MDDIPDELLLQIFKFLPISDIPHIIIVCTRWNCVLRDANFWRNRFLETYLFEGNSSLLRDFPRELFQIFYFVGRHIVSHRTEVYKDIEYKNSLLLGLVRKYPLLEIELIPRRRRIRGNKLYTYTFLFSMGTLEWCRTKFSHSWTYEIPEISLKGTSDQINIEIIEMVNLKNPELLQKYLDSKNLKYTTCTYNTRIYIIIE